MTPTDTTPERLLRIPEVADAFGVSRATIYNLIADGQFATTAVGSVTRISEAAVADFIRRNTTPARRAK
jgi:excisionase family DNA binding protein